MVAVIQWIIENTVVQKLCICSRVYVLCM